MTGANGESVHIEEQKLKVTNSSYAVSRLDIFPNGAPAHYLINFSLAGER
ncbi:hypothetical protein FACS1894139_07570 [Planctomycetales bacterium]|nr:hypothetical protein FACS1894107_14270 [Planctomycetales bacterium]GHT01898.1 hypothetical protein FACS1894108_15920 [Planctomycetales bacterium]GHT04814.1 hypothetical protein FACS1894139_07570 [Planctomycetales bacterium]